MHDLNVALIGDFQGEPDEGLKNIAGGIRDALEPLVSLETFQVTEWWHPGFWRGLREFKPEIIHFIPGPSPLGLTLLRLASRVTGGRSVVSLTRPQLGGLAQRLARLVRPDLVILQTPDQRDLARSLGSPHVLVAPGVDTDRFRPVSENERDELRKRHAVPTHASVILHVGHLKENRNLDVLADAAGDGYHVLMIASEYLEVDQDLRLRLEQAGCDVRVGYEPRIEDLYQLADAYLWPVRSGDSIALPLSVLEARASGLPVVTTRYPGLESFFADDPGVRVVDPEDLLSSLDALRSREGPSIPPRGPRSWRQVGLDLLSHYRGCLDDA